MFSFLCSLLNSRGVAFPIGLSNDECLYSDNKNMFNFIVSLLKCLFSIIFKKRKDIIFTLLLLKKENEIIKRHLNLNGQKITTNNSDRFCLSLIAALSKRAIHHLTIVKPETPGMETQIYKEKVVI